MFSLLCATFKICTFLIRSLCILIEKKKKEDIDPYLELNIFIYIAPETLNILYLELN